MHPCSFCNNFDLENDISDFTILILFVYKLYVRYKKIKDENTHTYINVSHTHMMLYGSYLSNVAQMELLEPKTTK